MTGALVGVAPAAADVSPNLTRYPYLTDSVQSSVTVNWATIRPLTPEGAPAATTSIVEYGPAPSCSGKTKTASPRTLITVNNVPQYQWKAAIAVSPDTAYCYRVKLNGEDLLGTDLSPTFTSQVRKGSSSAFSFAVFGDWGETAADGSANVHQAHVLQQMAASDARFAVMTGDTAYPGGSQTNYGDLRQTGPDVSSIFAPWSWAVPGRSLPVFNVTGNHGFANGKNQIDNWPQDNATSSSGGKYAMEAYAAVNGATGGTYPSFWYAFDAGPARFYALTASWSDTNPGNGGVYATDAAAHWTPSSAEYKWLANDLAAHPRALKFAFWHYPLYADTYGAGSDPYLQGPPGSPTLEGLLNAYGVNIAFNGHAHGYERNGADAGGMLSYVFGNGGADLGPINGCSAFDLYAIGSSLSACRTPGVPPEGVFGFARVTVDGQQVTVTPTDELGRTYDVQTYVFPDVSTGPVPPTNLVATPVSSTAIKLSWTASPTDGVTGYRVRRDGGTPVDVTGTSFQDTGLAPGSAHTYAVTTVAADGTTESRPSLASSTTVGPKPTPTPTPAPIPSATPTGSTGVVAPPPAGDRGAVAGASTTNCAVNRARVGVARADRMRGTRFADRMMGLGGADVLTGLGGADCLHGMDGRDRLYGGTGDDWLWGGRGADRLWGGRGADRLWGGAGNDRLTGGAGANTLFGGGGADTIDARNGARDVVRCGRGRDLARVDLHDRVSGCERVVVARA
jgi:Ca2+-binding RTX toxin-like protein